MLIEGRGEETAEGESGDDAEGECEDGIRSGQKGMHTRVSLQLEREKSFKSFTTFTYLIVILISIESQSDRSKIVFT